VYEADGVLGKNGAIASVLAGAVVALSLQIAPLRAIRRRILGGLWPAVEQRRCAGAQPLRPRCAIAAQDTGSQPDNAEALFQLALLSCKTRISISPGDDRSLEASRPDGSRPPNSSGRWRWANRRSDLAEARRLAAAGVYDRAIAAISALFAAAAAFDLAVEYYETLAAAAVAGKKRDFA